MKIGSKEGKIHHVFLCNLRNLSNFHPPLPFVTCSGRYRKDEGDIAPELYEQRTKRIMNILLFVELLNQKLLCCCSTQIMKISLMNRKLKPLKKKLLNPLLGGWSLPRRLCTILIQVLSIFQQTCHKIPHERKKNFKIEITTNNFNISIEKILENA